jgi:hypothetical protein
MPESPVKESSVISFYDNCEASPGTPKSSKLPLGRHKAMRRRSLGTIVVNSSAFIADGSIYNTANDGFNATADDPDVDRSVSRSSREASKSSLNDSSHSRRPRSWSRGARKRGSLYVTNKPSPSPAERPRRRALRRSSVGAIPMINTQDYAPSTVPVEPAVERSHRRDHRRSSLGAIPVSNVQDSAKSAVAMPAPDLPEERKPRKSALRQNSVYHLYHEAVSNLEDLAPSTAPASVSAPKPAEERQYRPARKHKSFDLGDLDGSYALGDLDGSSSSKAATELPVGPRSRRARRRSSLGSTPMRQHRSERKHKSLYDKSISDLGDLAGSSSSKAATELPVGPRSRRARRRSSLGSTPMSNLLDLTQNAIDSTSPQPRIERDNSLSLRRVLNDQDLTSPLQRWSVPSSNVVSLETNNMQRDTQRISNDLTPSLPTRRPDLQRNLDSPPPSPSVTSTDGKTGGSTTNSNNKKKKGKEKKKARSHRSYSPCRPLVRASSSSSRASRSKSREKEVPIVDTGNNKPLTQLRRIKSACAVSIQRSSFNLTTNEKKEIGKKGFLKKWLGIPSISSKK